MFDGFIKHRCVHYQGISPALSVHPSERSVLPRRRVRSLVPLCTTRWQHATNNTENGLQTVPGCMHGNDLADIDPIKGGGRLWPVGSVLLSPNKKTYEETQPDKDKKKDNM